jgi:hypothetical protein
LYLTGNTIQLRCVAKNSTQYTTETVGNVSYFCFLDVLDASTFCPLLDTDFFQSLQLYSHIFLHVGHGHFRLHHFRILLC